MSSLRFVPPHCAENPALYHKKIDIGVRDINGFNHQIRQHRSRQASRNDGHVRISVLPYIAPLGHDPRHGCGQGKQEWEYTRNAINIKPEIVYIAAAAIQRNLFPSKGVLEPAFKKGPPYIRAASRRQKIPLRHAPVQTGGQDSALHAQGI